MHAKWRNGGFLIDFFGFLPVETRNSCLSEASSVTTFTNATQITSTLARTDRRDSDASCMALMHTWIYRLWLLATSMMSFVEFYGIRFKFYYVTGSSGRLHAGRWIIVSRYRADGIINCIAFRTVSAREHPHTKKNTALRRILNRQMKEIKSVLWRK